MELPEIREKLSSLPPEQVAKLLREVLDQMPAQTPTPAQWTSAADRVVNRYREALERLAK